MIIKYTEVKLDRDRVMFDFKCSDAYEAVVLFEHITDCLSRGIGFTINMESDPNKALRIYG